MVVEGPVKQDAVKNPERKGEHLVMKHAVKVEL